MLPDSSVSRTFSTYVPISMPLPRPVVPSVSTLKNTSMTGDAGEAAPSDFAAEADTTSAVDASRHNCLDKGAEVLVFDGAFELLETTSIAAEDHALILEIAFSTLERFSQIMQLGDLPDHRWGSREDDWPAEIPSHLHRQVKRVCQSDTFTSLVHQRRICSYSHAGHNRVCAGCDWFRSLLDFN